MKNLDEMWRLNSRVIHHEIAKSMIAILWTQARKLPKEGTVGNHRTHYNPTTVQRTAFFADIGGMPCIVTAGHVLNDIRASCTGENRLIKARLIDGLHRSDSSVNDAIPFDFDFDKMFIANDFDGTGIDYGVIPLRQYFVNLMRSKGCTPCAPTLNAVDYYDVLVMAGFPDEKNFVNENVVNGATTVSLRLASGAALLQIISSDSDEIPEKCRKPFPRIHGRLLTTARGGLNDIVGMSGGPVFGIKINSDNLELGLLGVQSGWDPASRITSVCPLTVLDSIASRAVAD